MAQKKLVIVGGGGHGRVVLDTARAAGLDTLGFVDSSRQRSEELNGRPVIGGMDLLSDRELLNSAQFLVAIGDQSVRRRLSLEINAAGGQLATVIHPSSIISPTVRVGDGTVIVAGAIVNANASIGRFCILNTACSIDHDNTLMDGVQISPGVRSAGNVTFEEDVFVGIGASIIPGIRIGRNAIVGAGSVVVRDVKPDILVVGNPARTRPDRGP